MSFTPNIFYLSNNLDFQANALHNTIEDIKFNGDILDGKHKLTFVAKHDFANTREYGFATDFSYLFQGQTHSKANVNWNVKHLASSSDVNMLFKTGFETSLLRNKKYSIEFSHDTSLNWQKVKTFKFLQYCFRVIGVCSDCCPPGIIQVDVTKNCERI